MKSQWSVGFSRGTFTIVKTRLEAGHLSKQLKRLGETPTSGIVSLVIVWSGLALGHSLVVLQSASTGGSGLLNTMISWGMGTAGFVLVWIGMKRPETQGTLLGYLGGNLIWCGFFEWSWHYFAQALAIEPVLDNGIMILSPELLLIQATVLIVISLLIFLGANKDTRCRMFLWFHRNLRLQPGTMTAGYKRQYARVAAMETVFLIWTIYLFAIFINDPRGIRYDSTAAMAITLGFIAWSIYLVPKLLKIRGFGAAFRYGIAVGSVSWLPIEALSRWGLYPEVWVKPAEFPVIMSGVLLAFVAGLLAMYRTDSIPRSPAAPATLTEGGL